MNSFTQAEIAKRCNVTRATVSRWVDLSRAKKNNLQLDLTNKVARILDNPNNDLELKRLATDAKKYRNSIPLKNAKVSEDFYKNFTEEEVVEIITDLEFKKEISLKFAYKNDGANHWDDFYKSGVSPIKDAVLDFLNHTLPDIENIIADKELINIVDIGPGNGEPPINLIKSLNKSKRLNYYIPIDISNEIIEVTKKHILPIIPANKIKSYQADIEYSRFNKILLENISSELKISNLILMMGNTITNFNDSLYILKNLQKGMVEEDILAISFSLDSNNNKSILNYVKNKAADAIHTIILDILGIDTSKCEAVVEYNEKEKCKTKCIVLDKDYVIEFKLFGKTKLVQLEKDERIVVWKHYLSSMEDFIRDLHEAGYETLVTRKSLDLANGLVICQAKMN